MLLCVFEDLLGRTWMKTARTVRSRIHPFQLATIHVASYEDFV